MREDTDSRGDLILVLNSGSSSLKFGVYKNSSGDENPLLTGSAEGIGRDSGALQIRGGDGMPLLQRKGVHESQVDALTALAEAMQEHIRGTPAVVGHRVVHGGPNLCEHQRITPEMLRKLKAATHFAPLHIPMALKIIASAQSIFPIRRASSSGDSDR